MNKEWEGTSQAKSRGSPGIGKSKREGSETKEEHCMLEEQKKRSHGG